jgi:branched-chain amino acid aminotransferase
LKQATIDLVVQNHLKEGYIRHIVFVGDGAMGLHPQDNPIRVGIIVWEWGTYLGEEGLKKGVRCKISSYHRHHPTSTMVKAKTSANYLVSILAKREVTSLGYQEALLLDPNGFVAEGSGENVFIVRDGILKTPPTTYALEGITRDTVLRLARDLSLPVEIGNISRDELYTAEEAFLTGTAAEITPIREVDDRTIGEETPGKITRLLQNEYFRLVRGEKNAYLSFLTPLPSSIETKTQLQNF